MGCITVLCKTTYLSHEPSQVVAGRAERRRYGPSGASALRRNASCATARSSLTFFALRRDHSPEGAEPEPEPEEEEDDEETYISYCRYYILFIS